MGVWWPRWVGGRWRGRGVQQGPCCARLQTDCGLAEAAGSSGRHLHALVWWQGKIAELALLCCLYACISIRQLPAGKKNWCKAVAESCYVTHQHTMHKLD